MEDIELIERQDVEKILSIYRGNTLFQETLEQSSPETIVRTMIRYVYFNRLFGAGVAHLASRFARETELFRDPKEPSNLWNDRSMDVAALVFAAAIDEFGDRDTPSHPTHRTLAQAVIKGLVEYSGLRGDDIHDDLNYIRANIDREVCRGYGINVNADEQQLFRSLGYHIGSEILADKEFRILDRALREKHPGLVRHLEDATVTISETQVPAYRWIEIHTTVEIDHFDHALRAANTGLNYYSGTQKKSEVQQQILEGVDHFAQFQEEVMKYIANGLKTIKP